MILEALCKYYERMGDAGIEPGYTMAPVSSCITLSAEGDVREVHTLIENKKTRNEIVPYPPKRAGAAPEPAFLYENKEFIFGIHTTEKGADYRFTASQKKHEAVLLDVEDAGAQAILRFLQKRVKGSYAYPNVDTSPLEMGGFIIFRLFGDAGYLHNRPAIKTAWERYLANQSNESAIAQCLVSGELAPIARLHGNVRGFGQDKPTLVGFNQDSFTSFRKKQGENAPVSEKAAFQYVTALGALLADPSHIIRLAGDKVIFWAEQKAKTEESLLSMLFGELVDSDDGSHGAEETEARRIKGILDSIRNGKKPADEKINENMRIFLLGMAANRTRLVVRFFYTDTFGSLLKKLLEHYDDIDIVAPSWETKLPSPYRILLETAVAHKSENIPPSLPSALFRSILLGACYPYSLYMAILGRIRAEAGKDGAAKAINRLRVGLMKGYLNRNARTQNKEGMMHVALNEAETGIGYLLGRLFAVLERAQTDALGKVDASIVDKYLNSALAAPQSVFPVLLPLFEKHVSKSGRYYTKKMVSDILGHLSSDGFPKTMDAEEQGRFLVGYYHQRQALYTKKEADETSQNSDKNE